MKTYNIATDPLNQMNIEGEIKLQTLGTIDSLLELDMEKRYMLQKEGFERFGSSGVQNMVGTGLEILQYMSSNRIYTDFD